MGSTVDLDVYVPPGQPNPYWLGSVQMFLSIPSAAIVNAFVDHLELTPGGTGWQTLSFSLPEQLQAALLETHPDVRFAIATNTPSGAPSLVLDNMRFAGDLVPGASAPRLPIQFSFERGEVWNERDGDVASVSTSGAVAYIGSSSLEILFNGGSEGRVWTESSAIETIERGDTVTYRVYIPSGAPIVAIQPYVSDPNFTWAESWNTNFPKGGWATVAVTVPQWTALPVRQVGVKFYLDDDYDGAVYLDAVRW